MMIRAIVYDAVGTLIHVQPSVAAVYAEVGQRFGSQLDAGEIGRRFSAAFALQDRLDEQAGWRTSEERERQRWCDIVAQVLDDVADPVGCFDALFTAFAELGVWACDPGAVETLSHFQGRGLRQALASNFDCRLRSVVEPMPIRPFFEHILISSEVGWRKPAPEFFAALAESLQLPASDILYVGDDRGNDFEPARRAGMQSVLFDPKGKHGNMEARIARLADLVQWVVH